MLQQCLRLSVLSAQVYRYILDFLASQPTPEQIASLRSTPEMQHRLSHLLEQNAAGTIVAEKLQELDEYERTEHLIIPLKADTLPVLATTLES